MAHNKSVWFEDSHDEEIFAEDAPACLPSYQEQVYSLPGTF